jgi:hypothetical protein
LQWGMTLAGHPIVLPGLDDSLTQLTYGMLGMGALHVASLHPAFNQKK